VSAFADRCSCFFTFLAFDSRLEPSASSFRAFTIVVMRTRSGCQS